MRSCLSLWTLCYAFFIFLTAARLLMSETLLSLEEVRVEVNQTVWTV